MSEVTGTFFEGVNPAVPKIILVALNASYSHTNLAVRYLQQIALESGLETQIKEYTINDQINRIVDELIELAPDVLGFSCYIWNYEILIKVVERVKLACSDIQIMLGGPQVIDCNQEWMRLHSAVDLVMVGEGEIAFREWCQQYILANGKYEPIDGIWTQSSEVNIINNYVNRKRGVFGHAYENKEDLSNRLAYYETSRGCAYRCSYCLSSLDKRVRYRDMVTVKKDLAQLASSGAKTIKLVDRTFNLQEARAREIIDFWCSLPTASCLHCEIVAEIMSDEMLEYLAELPGGRLQFEIGVQSTNPQSLKAVNRRMNWVRTEQVIRKLLAGGNIHIHLDLLVGLPYEDFNSLRNSFNNVYSLQPHHLQLGMLKILPGTQMKTQAQELNYRYVSYPPYEIVSTPWLNAQEVVSMHQLAETMDKLYNGVELTRAHDELIAYFESPFDYWLRLAQLAWETGMFQSPQKLDNWAYLPVVLAQHRGGEQLAVIAEERIRFSLLQRERRYHFAQPFVDTSLTDKEYVAYRTSLEEKWPHLHGLSLKEIKRRVVIHRFSAIAALDGSGEINAFLYSDNGNSLVDHCSW